jgi:hypothetical protein
MSMEIKFNNNFWNNMFDNMLLVFCPHKENTVSVYFLDIDIRMSLDSNQLA